MWRSAVHGKANDVEVRKPLSALMSPSANVDVLAHAHEPIGMLRQRGDQFTPCHAGNARVAANAGPPKKWM